MPNLRGKFERSGSDREAESDEEFDFGTIEEVEDVSDEIKGRRGMTKYRLASYMGSGPKETIGNRTNKTRGT